MEVSYQSQRDRLRRILTPGRTRVDKVNAELVTLTYGTIVATLCKDFENDYEEVNKQLDKMGYNIGMRLIEDFLAKSNTGACSNFREVADMISKVREKDLTVVSLCSMLTAMTPGWLQNLSERYADSDQLVKRQQAVLSDL